MKSSWGSCLVWLVLIGAPTLGSFSLASPAAAADVSELLQEGRKYFERGEYDKALKIFTKVSRLDPRNKEARELQMMCSQKIVDKKLGRPPAEGGDKSREPSAPPEQSLSVSEKSPAEPSSGETGMSPLPPVTSPASLPSEPPPFPTDEPAVTSREVTLEPGEIAAVDPGVSPLAPPTGRILIEQRSSLAEEERRRLMGQGDAVWVQEKGDRVTLTFFLNRLFMPASDALASESYAVLDSVLPVVKTPRGRRVVLRAEDLQSAAVRHAFPDLSSRRATLLFAFILSQTFPLEEASSPEGGVPMRKQ